MISKYEEIKQAIVLFHAAAARYCSESKCSNCIFKQGDEDGCKCTEVLKIINAAYEKI